MLPLVLKKRAWVTCSGNLVGSLRDSEVPFLHTEGLSSKPNGRECPLSFFSIWKRRKGILAFGGSILSTYRSWKRSFPSLHLQYNEIESFLLSCLWEEVPWLVKSPNALSTGDKANACGLCVLGCGSGFTACLYQAATLQLILACACWDFKHWKIDPISLNSVHSSCCC